LSVSATVNLDGNPARRLQGRGVCVVEPRAGPSGVRRLLLHSAASICWPTPYSVSARVLFSGRAAWVHGSGARDLRACAPRRGPALAHALRWPRQACR